MTHRPLLAGVAALGLASPCLAQTAPPADEQRALLNRVSVKTDALEDALEASGLKGLKVSGLIDPTYLYTRNGNRAGFQFLDSSANAEYAIDNGAFGMAMLDIQKELETGTRWRFTLAPNRGGGGVAIDGQSIVHEASLSVPLGELQTRFIAGQIPDWSGDEYLQPTLNKLVTHNLLFDFTIPAVYTGAGVDLARGEWAIKALLANVNASKRVPGDKAPAFVFRVDYAKGEYSGLGAAGILGRMANWRADDGVGNPVTGQPYDTRPTRVATLEVDGYFVRADWTLTAQVGAGTQHDAAITADPLTGALRDSHWWGLTGLAAYKLTPHLEAVVRADYLANAKNGGGTLGYTFADARNGLGPDPAGDAERGTNRFALSLGARYTVDANLTFKTEVRMDRATLPVFLDQASGRYGHDNLIVGASAVLSF